MEWIKMSDAALSASIGKFIQHHRLRQNKSQEHVALEAGISRSTLSLLERGEKVMLNTLIQVLRVLDLLYIMDVFALPDAISPIAYAKLKKKERMRASKSNDTDSQVAEELAW